MKSVFKFLGFLVLAAIIFTAGIFVARFYMSHTEAPPAPAPKFFEGAKDLSGIKQNLSGNIIEVKNGQSIQEAVNKAKPGDLIRVFPGTYHETVYIDKDNLSFQGVKQEDDWATLDGEGKLNDGFLYSGNSISIEGFKIQNYKGNGVMGQSGNNFVISNNWVVKTGVYGIFPEFGKNGLIEHNILSGIADAAIYVGMCDNIDVRHNEVYESVAGIEIENSRHALVEDNYCHDNSGGILAFITPGLPIKTCYDVIIRNNYVMNNNYKNFAAAGSIVSYLPTGTGVIVMAADRVVIENNFINGNDNVGIAITDHKFLANIAVDPESDPNPDSLVILDNVMIGNGNNPMKEIKEAIAVKLVTKGPDILNRSDGKGNSIRDISRYRTYGLEKFTRSTLTSTASVVSYLLSEPVPPRKIEPSTKGRLTYYGVCSGCHAYNVRMIGPPTIALQAIYKDNPQGIADYIVNPVHKRKDYPEMPPQNYLSEETRLEVAKFMLTVDK